MSIISVETSNNTLQKEHEIRIVLERFVMLLCE